MRLLNRHGCLTLAVLAALGAAGRLRAQQGCPSGMIFQPQTGQSIFSAEQEVWLGEAEAAQIDPRLRLTRAPAMIGELQQIGDRLLASLPSPGFLYSLKSGDEEGSFFGRDPVLTRDGKLMALRSEPDHLYLYDLGSMEQRDDFVFATPTLLDHFSADGKRLLVVTADQTAFTFDLESHLTAVAAKP